MIQTVSKNSSRIRIGVIGNVQHIPPLLFSSAFCDIFSSIIFSDLEKIDMGCPYVYREVDESEELFRYDEIEGLIMLADTDKQFIHIQQKLASIPWSLPTSFPLICICPQVPAFIENDLYKQFVRQIGGNIYVFDYTCNPQVIVDTFLHAISTIRLERTGGLSVNGRLDLSKAH